MNTLACARYDKIIANNNVLQSILNIVTLYYFNILDTYIYVYFRMINDYKNIKLKLQVFMNIFLLSYNKISKIIEK